MLNYLEFIRDISTMLFFQNSFVFLNIATVNIVGTSPTTAVLFIGHPGTETAAS